MRHVLLAGAVLFALPLAAAAQGAPEAGGPADPVKERQEANAAKLAGLVRFVDESCAEAKPDYQRFKAVVAAMGVDLDALAQGALLMRSLGYTEAYRKDVEASCRRAVEMFGEKGTAVPGLVVRKTS